MAKKQGGDKLLGLPFTTFGELAAPGLKATVCCSGCYEHRAIDPAADHLRDRCFATAALGRFLLGRSDHDRIVRCGLLLDPCR